MGDRSTIAILQNDGKVESIFTYWNGFISGNGALLYQYYNSFDLAKNLIGLGHIYQLTDILEPPVGVKHTFEKPLPGISIFYTRDGGQKIEINKYASLEEYISSHDLQGYNYIFNEKKKEWYHIDRESKKIEKLTKFLLEDEEVNDFIKTLIKKEKLKNKLEKNLVDRNVEAKRKVRKV